MSTAILYHLQGRRATRNQDDENVQMILIMCYSGFRITEYKKLSVHLEGEYFQGGIKTAAGKNRIVPIHSAVREFVCARMEKYGCLIPSSVSSFWQRFFTPVLEGLGITGHTPHDTRHTLSMLCEKYGVRENDRKRIYAVFCLCPFSGLNLNS